MKLSDFQQKYMVDLSQLGQKGNQDLSSPQAAR